MPKSVLIVDDHEAVRRELRRLFRDYEEFTVCGEAQDGSEALTKAQQLLPDLIILDLVMPEMGGLEATTIIRERENASGKHVPILAMTAHAMSGDRERCLAAGMDGYISKPIHAAELLQLVGEHARASLPQ